MLLTQAAREHGLRRKDHFLAFFFVAFFAVFLVAFLAFFLAAITLCPC